MEIIARLREERAALVARVSQIDKMLRQYEEWGREAQQLLSLTSAVIPDSQEALSISADSPAAAEIDASDRPITHQVGEVRPRVRPQIASPIAQRKTPISEFEAAVIDVLRQTGEPMDRVALYDALIARGIVIGDGGREKDLNALSARVYRMAKDPKNGIFGERGQGYRLVANETSPTPTSHDATHVDDSGNDLLV